MATPLRHGLLAVVATFLLCACGGDSTRPRIDPMAAHFDSLAQIATANHDIARAGAMSTIALAYQSGVQPGIAALQDSGSALTYRAAVLWNQYDGSRQAETLAPRPNSWDLVLWQEPDGARYLFVQGSRDSVTFRATGDPDSPFGMADWGDVGRWEESVDGYARLAMGESTGACRLASSTVACDLVPFTVTLDVVLKPATGIGIIDVEAPPHPIAGTALAIPGLVTRRR